MPKDLFLPSSEQHNDSSTTRKKDDEVPAIEPLSPVEALKGIETHRKKINSSVILVDTHGHAHLDGEKQEIYTIDEKTKLLIGSSPVVSLTCSVQEVDWQATLDYASKNNKILPGLGVHPWYLADLSPNFLSKLEDLLVQHPKAIVGEIGLCKMARFLRTFEHGKTAALELQRRVFMDQMRLAARLIRPVSVHCVNQHGVFTKAIKELAEDDCCLPPVIGMHSFTGTAHHVKEILKLEKQYSPDKPLFYFGFSHTVNYVMCTTVKAKRQGQDAVREVPVDRLMAESDVQAPDNVKAGTAGAVAYIASCLDLPIGRVAELTALNGLAFLQTVNTQ
jgi:Tat protein secretion system quality control protein TatD with DNase activity